MTEAAEIGELFLTFSCERLQLLASRIADCLGRLSDEQIWQRGSEVENSVANLALHLCGNVRQWIISGVGGQVDIRKRDEEFARQDGVTTSELREQLETTISEAIAVIRDVPQHRLREKIAVQGRNPSVLEAIYVVVEHFGEHAGQIMYMTKQMTREDLGYHRHLSAQKSTR
jgi:uncharacterized damage-inducible protein DinB